MTKSAAEHWDTVYGTKATDEVSWFQRQPTTSQRLLTSVSSPSGAVIDVGAGASTLVDTLLDAGWSDVTVLDVSAKALALVRARVSDRVSDRPHDPPRERPGSASFVVADVLTWRPERTYDAWHDRAVFHFLVHPDQRDQYVATASRAVRSGGVVVLGTFAADGPTQCSGLPTARYDAVGLAAVFEPGFSLEHSEREEHETPGGAVQPFTWVVLRRI
ncbi:MAG TPA: class I SAM-dependent methyltransferase [Dermatophilaceae bacterium]|nr:class I SAM-dependent methyltransferase [Dermatophilaceae bacterium]